MYKKVVIRVNELQLFVKELLNTDIMRNKLDFKDATLDLDKLIMLGHSLGGATAIKFAHQNKDIKCLVTLDPWVLSI